MKGFILEKPHKLTPRQESCLKASKEIAVKYIELGRLSMDSFPARFAQIYRAVQEAIDIDQDTLNTKTTD